MRQRMALAAIKTVHTVAFALIATSILIVLLDGLRDARPGARQARSESR